MFNKTTSSSLLSSIYINIDWFFPHLPTGDYWMSAHLPAAGEYAVIEQPNVRKRGHISIIFYLKKKKYIF